MSRPTGSNTYDQSTVPPTPALSVATERVIRPAWGPKTGSPAALVNLTGYTARMQIREELASAAVLLSLTTENGGITLGGALGTIDLFISAADTTAITWEGGVYDLELVAPSTDVTRLIDESSVTVSFEVTR